MFSSNRFHRTLANTALGRTQNISNLPLLSPKKIQKGVANLEATPLFSLPSSPCQKGPTAETAQVEKSREKEEKERRAEWGQFQFSKPRKRRGGRTTDRPGRERESGKLSAFPPPPSPQQHHNKGKRNFSWQGGPSLQGWRECPGWMEDCCSVFGSKIGGRGRQRVVCLEGREFYPSFFSSPFLFLARPLPKAPSPLLLSSKAGRRVSGGRKEPRRRSSTPPSHFPPPSPKNPYPFVFFPGGRPAPSLPNHPTTASSSSIPSSLSLSGEAFAVADFPSRWGGGRNKVFRAFRKEEEEAVGNGEQGGEGDRICAQSCPGHPSGGCEQTFLLSQSQPVFCLAFLSRSGEKERELKKQGRIDSVCERGRG